MTSPLQRPYVVRVRATGQESEPVLATSPWSAYAHVEHLLGHPRYRECDVTVVRVPTIPPPSELPSPPWGDVRKLMAKAIRLGRAQPNTPLATIIDEVIAEGLP